RRIHRHRPTLLIGSVASGRRTVRCSTAMSKEPLLDGPSVAVVIPAWDDYVQRDLERAVASVTSQDLPARVIVVDNASRRPIPPLDGVSVVSTGRRLTRGAARNVGLELVTEPFVVFL